jgi:hypothetical protein
VWLVKIPSGWKRMETGAMLGAMDGGASGGKQNGFSSRNP